MKEPGTIPDLAGIDSLCPAGIPDFGQNRARFQRMEIHEVEYTGERMIREKTITRVMNELIESGDFIFTSDRGAVLRCTVPAEKNHPSFYIEISEGFLS